MPIPKALTSRINSLKSGIGEAADKYFLGEGWKVVKEGIEAGWLPRWLILSGESLERYKEIFSLISSSVETYVINSKEMEKLSTLETPPGIMGIFPRKDFAFPSGDIIVLIDGVQDPGNLGTIIRTADAVNASSVIVLKNSVDPYNHKVVRGSMGSIFHIPVFKWDRVEDLLTRIEKRYYTVGTSSHSGDLFYNFKWRFPLAVIFGNEGRGLSEEIEKICDATVKIPILGKAESLNVAVACGVILYEIIRNMIK